MIAKLDSETEALAKAVQFEDKEAKVYLVLDLIRANKWEHGATVKALANTWRTSERCVRNIHAEAKRLFRHHIDDPEAIRGELVNRMDYIVNDAMRKKKAITLRGGDGQADTVEYVEAPDHSAAIKGLMGIADLCGLKQKKASEKDELRKMPIEDLILEMNKALGKTEDIVGEADEETSEIRVEQGDSLGGDGEQPPDEVFSGGPTWDEDY